MAEVAARAHGHRRSAGGTVNPGGVGDPGGLGGTGAPVDGFRAQIAQMKRAGRVVRQPRAGAQRAEPGQRVLRRRRHRQTA